MNNELRASSSHVRLLYIMTIGLILSNILTLALTYAMVTSVKDSMYQAGVQPLRTEARTPLQYDDAPRDSRGGGGGTIGTTSCPFNSRPPTMSASNFSCEGGSRESCTNKCLDVYLACVGKYCYAYPQGSSEAYTCLTNWGEFYAGCTSLCTQVCGTSGGGNTRTQY